LFGIGWAEFRRTFITVILTIIIIWILKEITQRYNVPVVTEIIQKGA
jgi:hypothetical protein